MCAMYGQILEIRLFQDKGYAFVRYASRESAAAAILGIHNSEIHGHLVRCSWGKEMRDPHVIKVIQQVKYILYYPTDKLYTFTTVNTL